MGELRADVFGHVLRVGGQDPWRDVEALEEAQNDFRRDVLAEEAPPGAVEPFLRHRWVPANLFDQFLSLASCGSWAPCRCA